MKRTEDKIPNILLNIEQHGEETLDHAMILIITTLSPEQKETE
jgi:hypothetical protein